MDQGSDLFATPDDLAVDATLENSIKSMKEATNEMIRTHKEKLKTLPFADTKINSAALNLVMKLMGAELIVLQMADDLLAIEEIEYGKSLPGAAGVQELKTRKVFNTNNLIELSKLLLWARNISDQHTEHMVGIFNNVQRLFQSQERADLMKELSLKALKCKHHPSAPAVVKWLSPQSAQDELLCVKCVQERYILGGGDSNSSSGKEEEEPTSTPHLPSPDYSPLHAPCLD